MFEPGDIVAVALVLFALAVIAVAFVMHRRHKRQQETVGPETIAGEPPTESEQEADILQRRLHAAGLHVSSWTFVALIFAVALAASLFVLNLFVGLLLPAVITFVLVAYILYNVVFETAQRRALRFEEKLVDAIDLLIGALRSGENPAQAIAAAAEVAEPPVKNEFLEVAHRLQLGLTIRRAQARLLERYDCEGVRLFTSTLAAKWTAGGDLAPVLGVVNQIIRERLRYRLRLQSQLAGARIASVIVALSPYLLLLAFQWRNPEWIDRLITHPAGPPLLFGAIALQVFGFLWLRRMMKVTL
jgi:tight adherence protein B